VTAEELEKIVNPASVLMSLRASTFDECLTAFAPVIQTHPAVSEPGVFIDSVRAREAAVSTQLRIMSRSLTPERKRSPGFSS
jgi:hypothetical protein